MAWSWDTMYGGATLSSIGSIGTGLINAVSSSRAAKKAFRYNKQLIEMQQNWQEKMSNTAHQREVQDLRKAGLNPILSATGGSGASFGGASAPGMSVTPAQFDNPLDKATAYQEYKNMKATQALTTSQEKLSDNQSKVATWQALLNQQQYDDVIPEQIKSIIQDRENSKAVSSAQVYNLIKQGDAAVNSSNAQMFSALTNRLDYELKKSSDAYGSPLGRSLTDIINILTGNHGSAKGIKSLRGILNPDGTIKGNMTISIPKDHYGHM